MDPTDIGLFSLAERRMAWVDERQRLLAQNVANANTPGYQPRDVAPFAATLSSAQLLQTQPNHLSSSGRAGGSGIVRGQDRSPNGNSISIEDQLGRVADTAGIQELALNLHRRYQSMMRTAFGRAG